MNGENTHMHDEDFRRFISSAVLSHSVDGLLVSLESFLFVLEEDSRKYGTNVVDELSYYLRKKEAEPFLSGLKSCRESFEYLVLETPRFRLVRKYFSTVSGILDELADLSIDRSFECISPPPLWRKEALVYEERGYEEKRGLMPVKISAERTNLPRGWIDIALIIALAATVLAAILRFLL